jgi:hypothetical protein
VFLASFLFSKLNKKFGEVAGLGNHPNVISRKPILAQKRKMEKKSIYLPTALKKGFDLSRRMG